MAYIDLVSERDAKGKLQRVYEAARQRAGSVAQIIQVMSLDENVCHASIGFYAQLMKSPNALSAARREMLATVVSNANDCFY